jgi:hypothetical protein
MMDHEIPMQNKSKHMEFPAPMRTKSEIASTKSSMENESTWEH